jgi:PhoH-like ATPase
VRGLTLVLGLSLFAASSAQAHDTKQAYASAIAALADKVCQNQLNGAQLEEARKKWQDKIVIFDTNVLLNDPYAIYKYPGAEIVLPGTVVEEIDAKKEQGNTSKAAREFMRIMDAMISQGGSLATGVDLGFGSHLRVDSRNLTHLLEGTTFEKDKKDNEIIALALAYTLEAEGHGNVVLVTNDRTVRVKANSQDVVSEPFQYDWVLPAHEVEISYHTLAVSEQDYQQFHTTGKLPKPADSKIRPNEFVMIVKQDGEGCDECLARYFYDREDPKNSHLRRVPMYKDIPAPPKNLEQRMLLDLELDPTIPLVLVEADAGAGKTLMTLQAAVLQGSGNRYPNAGQYENITITKPMTSMGRGTLGTLPGDTGKKLKEKLSSFYDNLRLLQKLTGGGGPKAKDNRTNRRNRNDGGGNSNGSSSGNGSGNSPRIKTPDAGDFEIAPFPELRGRSFHSTYLQLDEGQNTGIHEARTVLTRTADDSKIIMLGNAKQIDDPYLNERNNGLSVTISLFMGEDLTDEERSLVGYVQLREGVRSPLTNLTNKLFDKLPKN